MRALYCRAKWVTWGARAKRCEDIHVACSDERRSVLGQLSHEGRGGSRRRKAATLARRDVRSSPVHPCAPGSPDMVVSIEKAKPGRQRTEAKRRELRERRRPGMIVACNRACHDPASMSSRAVGHASVPWLSCRGGEQSAWQLRRVGRYEGGEMCDGRTGCWHR